MESDLTENQTSMIIFNSFSEPWESLKFVEIVLRILYVARLWNI